MANKIPPIIAPKPKLTNNKNKQNQMHIIPPPKNIDDFTKRLFHVIGFINLISKLASLLFILSMISFSFAFILFN